MDVPKSVVIVCLLIPIFVLLMHECELKSAYIFPGITNISRMRTPAFESLKEWVAPHYDFLSELLSKDIRACVVDGKCKGMGGIEAQIIGYAASCAVYDHYVEKRGESSYISGYSVGVFAAFYAARSISFLNGVG